MEAITMGAFPVSTFVPANAGSKDALGVTWSGSQSLTSNGFVSRSASASVPYAPTTFASPSSATGSVAACSVPHTPSATDISSACWLWVSVPVRRGAEHGKTHGQTT